MRTVTGEALASKCCTYIRIKGRKQERSLTSSLVTTRITMTTNEEESVARLQNLNAIGVLQVIKNLIAWLKIPVF